MNKKRNNKKIRYIMIQTVFASLNRLRCAVFDSHSQRRSWDTATSSVVRRFIFLLSRLLFFLLPFKIFKKNTFRDESCWWSWVWALCVCVWVLRARVCVKQENEHMSATLHEFIEKIITSHVRRLAHPHKRASRFESKHHRHHNRHLHPYQFLGARLPLINLWILIRTERLIKVVGHQLIVHFNESDYPLWLITPSRDRLCATRDRR